MLGLDLSNLNGPVPLERLRGGPYRFCYHKRSEGTGFVDWLYPHHAELARHAGLAFGPYHYARLRESPHAQVELLFQHYRPRTGDLVVALDIEAQGNEGVAPEFARDWVRQAVRLVHRELGAYPVIYCSPGWWTGAVAAGGELELRRCPLWVAHYDVRAPAIPREWRGIGWTLWQRSDNATIAGHHPIDLDQAHRLPLLRPRRLLHPKPAARAIGGVCCPFLKGAPTVKTPDITPAQILAVLTALGGQAVAFGLLTGATEQKFVSIASLAVGLVWKLADAWIRHGRSKAAAIQALEQLALEHTAITQATAPATG